MYLETYYDCKKSAKIISASNLRIIISTKASRNYKLKYTVLRLTELDTHKSLRKNYKETETPN